MDVDTNVSGVIRPDLVRTSVQTAETINANDERFALVRLIDPQVTSARLVVRVEYRSSELTPKQAVAALYIRRYGARRGIARSIRRKILPDADASAVAGLAVNHLLTIAPPPTANPVMVGLHPVVAELFRPIGGKLAAAAATFRAARHAYTLALKRYKQMKGDN